MADLLTTETLARWTQNDPAEVAADPFAVDLIDKVSQLVQFIGGHPEWSLEPDETKAPFDVQMVVLQVCKRSYENPTRIIQEGNIGPLGGDRFADEQALFMDLTETERATIAKYNPDGDPNGGAELFTLTVSNDMQMPSGPDVYFEDNQQVGLSNSADPRSWMIPMVSGRDADLFEPEEG